MHAHMKPECGEPAAQEAPLLRIMYGRQGRASGEAYVVFVTAEDAKQGLAKHREMLENRYIEAWLRALMWSGCVESGG